MRTSSPFAADGWGRPAPAQVASLWTDAAPQVSKTLYPAVKHAPSALQAGLAQHISRLVVHSCGRRQCRNRNSGNSRSQLQQQSTSRGCPTPWTRPSRRRSRRAISSLGHPPGRSRRRRERHRRCGSRRSMGTGRSRSHSKTHRRPDTGCNSIQDGSSPRSRNLQDSRRWCKTGPGWTVCRRADVHALHCISASSGYRYHTLGGSQTASRFVRRQAHDVRVWVHVGVRSCK